jgi:hypothetical protein
MWSIAAGYAAAFVVSAGLLFARYLQELYNRAEVSGAGGMYAAGDLFLGIFIVCLFMIPTIFLIWCLARSETFAARYSQFLVGLSLSAPVSLALLYTSKSHVSESLITACLCRLALSPFVLVGIGVSRWVARLGPEKKLTSYALLIEGLTFCIAIALLIRG